MQPGQLTELIPEDRINDSPGNSKHVPDSLHLWFATLSKFSLCSSHE